MTATPLPCRLSPSDHRYEQIQIAHATAVAAGEPGYQDPYRHLYVLTSAYLRERGECCGSGCRHCPYTGDATEWRSEIKPPG